MGQFSPDPVKQPRFLPAWHSQATLPLCRAETFRSLPASVHPGGLQALCLLTTHLSASLNPAATAGPGGDSSCGGREWCQSEALRAAVPTNLQQRKDSFRLKFRAPARGTSHGHPQSQVGRERRTVRGEECWWYPFSSSQHGSCVICLHVKQPRPGPCTFGFPVTQAAELKPSDFPGGARPSPGPLPAVRNPVVPGGFVASGTDGEGLGTGTACPGACGSTAQAWGAGRSLHGLLSERCRSPPASR